MRLIEPFFSLSQGIPQDDECRIASGIIFAIGTGSAGMMRLQPPIMPQIMPQINEIWQNNLEQSEIPITSKIARNPQKINVLGCFGRERWCRLRDSNT